MEKKLTFGNFCKKQEIYKSACFLILRGIESSLFPVFCPVLDWVVDFDERTFGENNFELTGGSLYEPGITVLHPGRKSNSVIEL